jgi:hypothetical protein
MRQLTPFLLAAFILAPTAAQAYEPNSGFGPSFTGEVPAALAGDASDAGPLWAIEPAAGADAPVEGSVTVQAERLGRNYSEEARTQNAGPRIIRIPAERLHKIDPQTLGPAK